MDESEDLEIEIESKRMIWEDTQRGIDRGMPESEAWRSYVIARSKRRFE